MTTDFFKFLCGMFDESDYWGTTWGLPGDCPFMGLSPIEIPPVKIGIVPLWDCPGE